MKLKEEVFSYLFFGCFFYSIDILVFVEKWNTLLHDNTQSKWKQHTAQHSTTPKWMTLTVRKENGMGICINTVRGSGISYRYWKGSWIQDKYLFHVFKDEIEMANEMKWRKRNRVIGKQGKKENKTNKNGFKLWVRILILYLGEESVSRAWE